MKERQRGQRDGQTVQVGNESPKNPLSPPAVIKMEDTYPIIRHMAPT